MNHTHQNACIISPFDQVVQFQGAQWLQVPTACGLFVNETGDRFAVYAGERIGGTFWASAALSPNCDGIDATVLLALGLSYCKPEHTEILLKLPTSIHPH